jgi:hypothetical protein
MGEGEDREDSSATFSRVKGNTGEEGAPSTTEEEAVERGNSSERILFEGP